MSIKNGILATTLLLASCESPILGNKSYGININVVRKGGTGIIYQREWGERQIETESYAAYITTNNKENELRIGGSGSSYITPFCDHIEGSINLLQGNGACQERWK